MLQLFHHYFEITVKIRKNRILHRFFDFSPWSRNNYVMIPTTWKFPVNFTPKKYTSKLNFEKKKFSFPERGLRFGLKIGKRSFWHVWRNFFFSGKKSWSSCFLGWNLPEITFMLQLFHHYFEITVKIRKNRILHHFFDFSPWSRNNYVMIPTTWKFPVNFTPKNYTSKLNYEKEKFSIPERGLRFGLKIGKRPFWDVGRNFFFFVEKKVDHRVFWSEIYRRLP